MISQALREPFIGRPEHQHPAFVAVIALVSDPLGGVLPVLTRTEVGAPLRHR